MSKSKVHMPSYLKNTCQKAIKVATLAAVGEIQIQMSDTIPITAAQVVMSVSLGKIFDLTISEAISKSIIGLTLTQQVGCALMSNILKCISGG
jgi:uncharacterized protein (DUF697 family)